MSYDLTKTQLTTLKTRLTRAKNSGNPSRILTVVADALATFEKNGYPDCWQDWTRARDDAQFRIGMGSAFNLTKRPVDTSNPYI